MTVTGTGWQEEYIGGSLEAEARALAEVMPLVKEIQQTVAKRQSAEIRRGFHNKGSVVRVRLDVKPDIPEHLRVWPLLPNASLEGFARFSRSQSLYQPDLAPDQRGFAFRVTEGDRRQDFLFSNTPVCFAPDPVVFLKAGIIFAGTARLLLPLRMLFRFGPFETIRMLKLALVAPRANLGFTHQSYWSRTPFAIESSAVKFMIRPRALQTEETHTQATGALALEEHLQGELSMGERQFELCVQHYVDADRTPIERSDVPWDPSAAPDRVIATLTLPQQDPDKELVERVESAEAFNPWVTEAILPLGRMNRARREAYRLSAVKRGAQPGRLEDPLADPSSEMS